MLKVTTAGTLRLAGSSVRGRSRTVPAAGEYRLVVAPKGPTTRRLRRVGKAKVDIKVSFKSSGETKLVAKKIALRRPDPGK